MWAPEATSLEVVFQTQGRGNGAFALQCSQEGFFAGESEDVHPGDLYCFRMGSERLYPDPASRYQPQGVHGPSQVIDAGEFHWSDEAWTGIALENLVLYEIHVGTFTPAGTFAAAATMLPFLRDVGVTAVELLPVADFPGERNWGYDGAALFAPARCYGTADDLRRFVDEAHRIGLAVHLDVVYNHLGPDGCYLDAFSPYYFSPVHKSPWGAAINFDGPNSIPVRRFFIENALHWIHEYHVDGLRLDATHAIVDESPRHFLAEFSAEVRKSLAGSRRNVVLAAEDVRNLNCMVKAEEESGWGLDAVWSDDFHHQVRRFLTGDRDGYFADFAGSLEDIATTCRQGWFYSGQPAPYFGGNRGTNPAGIPARRFVFFLQNHDQVGNRAFGDRLHHQVDMAVYRAATALLLLLPQTPLLFMGQEWAATTPFQFFTDHSQELGKLVTEGRRQEFSRFAAFSDPSVRDRIPDPQALDTFEKSLLLWDEISYEPHASTIRFYKALLALRRAEPACWSQAPPEFGIWAVNEDVLLLRREDQSAPALLAVLRMRGRGWVDLWGSPHADPGSGNSWTLCLSSEDVSFSPDTAPPRVDLRLPGIDFARAGAVILKSTEAAPQEEI
ncbi:MAG: malto-oligosyltrehalose trehalohydrolase [Acidobacteria bacterium]|nr:malto-oligosyltrehalose trehalohydrolase [Acidobacteriota bacterium]